MNYRDPAFLEQSRVKKRTQHQLLVLSLKILHNSTLMWLWSGPVQTGMFFNLWKHRICICKVSWYFPKHYDVDRSPSFALNGSLYDVFATSYGSTWLKPPLLVDNLIQFFSGKRKLSPCPSLIMVTSSENWQGWPEWPNLGGVTPVEKWWSAPWHRFSAFGGRAEQMELWTQNHSTGR